MTYREYATLLASACIAALMFSATAALAASGGAPRAAFAAAQPAVRPPVAGAFRHHHRHGVIGGVFWPGYGYGDEGAAPSYGGAVEGVPPAAGDIQYTYKYDVPWDWAHRFPPSVTPSNRAYVPSCTDQSVTVPGRDGADHSVNVTRCY
ncbi:hypothetical protein [Bradyrhizobium sp.]|uniref:hypothetical protein n=2 Tax=Bradyrhizobium sp. TaxID=376 RepID=UPI001DEFB933|nr:hypothetical protein [Bradyrhizobium sp.]MBV8701543.1 hypothetical protein [Bradyrhizobium sp.]MBV8922804.1 hypothetical protein [Bradyrhizobium sp.]